MTRIATTNYSAASRGRDAIECDFIPQNGRYFDRCRSEASWREVWVRTDGTRIPKEYGSLRCDRHRKIDERTAANRGWMAPREYDAFDADAAWNAAVETSLAAQRQAADALWAEAAKLVAKRDAKALRELFARA